MNNKNFRNNVPFIKMRNFLMVVNIHILRYLVNGTNNLGDGK